MGIAAHTLAGAEVTVTGIAKGAGMIRPDMATLLAFIATDAAVDEAVLRPILGRCRRRLLQRHYRGWRYLDQRFLRSAGHWTDPGPSYPAVGFRIMKSVRRDGARGLRRSGAKASSATAKARPSSSPCGSRAAAIVAECRQVAYTIAHSPLVKTAFFASDPNWGRILAAVGRAGLADLALERVAIHLDEVCIVRAGGRASGIHRSARATGHAAT
jgi:glutamate N-acetyltransferase/amino-acid N-acetyltransferase